MSILQPGSVLMAPIADPRNQRIKLLSEGIEITNAFIEALKRRGIDNVILSVRDIAILNAFSPQGRRTKVPDSHDYVQSTAANDFTEVIDQQLEQNNSLSVSLVPQPTIDASDRPAGHAYADGLQLQWAKENNEQIDRVDEFLNDTIGDTSDDIGPLRAACLDLLDRIAEDQDALVCMASTPFDSDYPTRHGVHLAGIAISIGVEMGLDEPDLIDLGIGCLLHDVGMRAVGLRMFATKSVLSYAQLRRLADHPVRALEVAGTYGEAVSEASRMVAYQIHERLDGSGYPRGRSAEQIHPLAKIAAVADAFVGMLTRRQHRLAIQGYYVMAKLLDEMKAGKFDVQVIRALLHATSLYPLGSFVTFDNQCVGRVIRSGREEFVRPTVEMWHQDHLDRDPVIVDLKHDPTIQITGSIPAPRAA